MLTELLPLQGVSLPLKINKFLNCVDRVIARQCMETVDVFNYRIEEGMIVQANVWELHYDKTVWGSDPSSFDPER